MWIPGVRWNYWWEVPPGEEKWDISLLKRFQWERADGSLNVALESPFPDVPLPCPGRLIPVSVSVPLELYRMGMAFPCPDRKHSGMLRVFLLCDDWVLEKPGNT